MRVRNIFERCVRSRSLHVRGAVSTHRDLRKFAIVHNGVDSGRKTQRGRTSPVGEREPDGDIAVESVVEIQDGGGIERVNPVHRNAARVAVGRPVASPCGRRHITKSVKTGAVSRLIGPPDEHTQLLRKIMVQPRVDLVAWAG